MSTSHGSSTDSTTAAAATAAAAADAADADADAADAAAATSWRECGAVTRPLLELPLVLRFLGAAPPCGRSRARVHVVHVLLPYGLSTAGACSRRALAAGLMA